MKKNLFNYLGVFLLIFAAGCSDMGDVEPMVDKDALTESELIDALNEENLRKQKDSNELSNLYVTGDLSDGGTFSGVLTVNSFSYDEEKGLQASGVLKGIASTKNGRKIPYIQEFTDVKALLASGDVNTAQDENECPILFLDLGPISLDLLGLQVDLSQVILEITAVPGAGNLLGNLLCAVAGLLDPLTGLIDFVGDLSDLLDRINNFLGLINDILG